MTDIIGSGNRLAAIVLAAGQGTRMRSKLPKVLHRLAGKTMIGHVLSALSHLQSAKTVVVIGHGAEAVRDAVGEAAAFVVQEPQLGTGDAVRQATALLANWQGDVLVLCGDTPLLCSDTLNDLLREHHDRAATITMLSAHLDDPTGYGRVVRTDRGTVGAIVEEQAATPEERDITEINSGVYCFNGSWLRSRVTQIQRHPAKGEYYLTDLIALAVADGRTVATLTARDSAEALGINTRVQLAEAEEVLRWRVRRDLMLGGVTLVDPASSFIDAGVEIGQDTVIWPNCLIEGATEIAKDCDIGPGSRLVNARIGARSRVAQSVIEDSAISEDVTVGPFSHLRNGADVGQGAQIGNFAEIKKSIVGTGSKMHHFSYLGDATVGRDVNIGAGTITCNFNSETGVKSATVIEDEAALGSDTMLVAPVRVGRGATTGAGSVVTNDLPADSLAYGVPAKVVRKARREG